MISLLLLNFSATVAQDYSTFWPGIESKPIQISKRPGVDDPLPPDSPIIPLTTPPYFSTEKPVDLSQYFDTFYTDCNVKKSCFGTPTGCVKRQNCKAVTAVTVLGDRYIFEVKTGSGAWVGVGLSNDNTMGDDSVMECVKDGNNVKAFMSWTSPRPNLGVSRKNIVSKNLL